MDIYLDGCEEADPDLALDAHAVLPDRWNGWARPLATAAAVGRFLDAWRANDPNGTWGYVTEVDDSLICTRTDSEDYEDIFPKAGVDDTGVAIYDLTGWAWAQPLPQ